MWNTYELPPKLILKMSNELYSNLSLTNNSNDTLQNIIIVPEYINSIILAPVIYMFYQGK